MNSEYTVTVKEETMVLTYGRAKNARPMHCAAGHVWYVVGALNGLRYDQYVNLIMNHAISMNVPALSVRRYSVKVTKGRATKTETPKMKGF